MRLSDDLQAKLDSAGQRHADAPLETEDSVMWA